MPSDSKAGVCVLIYGYVKSHRDFGITEMCFEAHLVGVSVDLRLVHMEPP